MRYFAELQVVLTVLRAYGLSINFDPKLTFYFFKLLRYLVPR